MGTMLDDGGWAKGTTFSPGLRLGRIVCALSSPSGLSSSTFVRSSAISTVNLFCDLDRIDAYLVAS